MTDDLQKHRELHDAAKALLDDRAFAQAILDLRKQWFDELLATLHTEQILELRAMIKALEAIPVELTVRINNYKKAVHDAARRQHG